MLSAAGGTAGSTYSVDINADHYSPENTTVEAGDSVRWRAIDYYDSTTTVTVINLTMLYQLMLMRMESSLHIG